MIKISRRKLLAGLAAGGALLSPLYDSLVAQAAGTTSYKLITAFSVWGIKEAFFQIPTGPIGALNPAFAPFQRHASEFGAFWDFKGAASIGLHGPFEGSHYTGTYVTDHGGGNELAGGPSFDHYASATLSQGQPFRMLAMDGVKGGRSISRDDLGNRVTAARPDTTYKRLFGAGQSTGPTAAQTLASDKSVLDYAVSDIQRLNARLAAPEQAKLDQYLTSIRELETQLDLLSSLKSGPGCQGGAGPTFAPTGALDPAYQLAAAKVSAQVAASAIICGMTSVVTLYLGGADHNQTMHGGGAENDAEFATMSAAWYEALAEMVDTLKATPSGNGSVWDSTLLVHFPDTGGHHSSDLCGFLMGNLGGKLSLGRSKRMPSGKHTGNDFMAGLAQLLDVQRPDNKFGEPALCSGPMDFS